MDDQKQLLTEQLNITKEEMPVLFISIVNTIVLIILYFSNQTKVFISSKEVHISFTTLAFFCDRLKIAHLYSEMTLILSSNNV